MIMRTVLLALALAIAFPAISDTQTVTIKGKTYAKGLIPKKVKNPKRARLKATDYPVTYDAVANGHATPVKGAGQGQCGDCWAWARTSSLEAAAIAIGKPMTLSEEDTTDNASDESGCDGGSMDFNYEIQHGVALLATCPWEGGEGSCDGAVAAKGVNMAYIGDENGPTDAELMAAIYQYGSVAVTVAAGGSFDVDPGTDRMTSCGSTGIDHMVSLVGYRPAPNGGVEYKMKNSWGPDWGAQGYAYLAKGCNEIAMGDQSAMVVEMTNTPPNPPPAPTPTPTPVPAPKWACSASGLAGPTYMAIDVSESAASADAKQQCKAAGHWFCRVNSCSQAN